MRILQIARLLGVLPLIAGLLIGTASAAAPKGVFVVGVGEDSVTLVDLSHETDNTAYRRLYRVCHENGGAMAVTRNDIPVGGLLGDQSARECVDILLNSGDKLILRRIGGRGKITGSYGRVF